MSDSPPFLCTGKYRCSNTDLPTRPPIVYDEDIQDTPTVFEEIEDMLVCYVDGIPESRFETSYKDWFKRSLDYNSLGVETIEELLDKMCEEGMVLLDKDPKTNDRNVKLAPMDFSEFQDMPPTESSEIHERPTESSPTKSSDLFQEIQRILKGYLFGVTMYWLEKRYIYNFGRSPDYGSVDVKDMKELIDKMKDKGRVLLYEYPESKEKYVMCAWTAETVRELLKDDVLAVLDAHDGEILLSQFDRAFKDRFKLKLKYHCYGLKDIYHLCEVLDLGLEEADSPPGEMVIKARKKID